VSDKTVELAKSGDTTALRLCLDRIIASMRAKDDAVVIEQVGSTFQELRPRKGLIAQGGYSIYRYGKPLQMDALQIRHPSLNRRRLLVAKS
jgi:hypothetical protein